MGVIDGTDRPRLLVRHSVLKQVYGHAVYRLQKTPKPDADARVVSAGVRPQMGEAAHVLLWAEQRMTGSQSTEARYGGELGCLEKYPTLVRHLREQARNEIPAALAADLGTQGAAGLLGHVPRDRSGRVQIYRGGAFQGKNANSSRPTVEVITATETVAKA
jgi:hypothetical protein